MFVKRVSRACRIVRWPRLPQCLLLVGQCRSQEHFVSLRDSLRLLLTPPLPDQCGDHGVTVSAWLSGVCTVAVIRQ